MHQPTTNEHHRDEQESCHQLTITTARYRITVRTHTRYAPPSTGIYVPDRVALDFDEQLDHLAARKADLGDLRWCPSVAEGGSHPEIDQLYHDLRVRMATVKTTLAVAAVGFLAIACPDLLEGDLPTALGRAVFDRYAGCRTCPCTPGVVAGSPLRTAGHNVDIAVDAGPAVDPVHG